MSLNMNDDNYQHHAAMLEIVWKPNWLQRFVIRTLSTGALPKHICAIMDGNRRWAKNRGMNKIDGHIIGMKSLNMLFQWMKEFDIYQLTAFAFSVENFKREKAEVMQLMQIFEDRFQYVINNREELKEKGIRFMVYGNIDHLPPNVRRLAAKAMLETWNNKPYKLNLAIAYTASDETETVSESLKKAVADGDLLPEDIDETLIEKCLYTSTDHCPDLLIRTSGEYRLSDFLLWQLMHKPLFICRANWPDLSFTELCKAIFTFQRHFSKTNKVQKDYEQEFRIGEKITSDFVTQRKAERVKQFLAKREQKFLQRLSHLSSN